VRRPSIFKKTDVTRATNAVRAAGLEIARVEINKEGVIVVVPRYPLERPSGEAEPNEWDSVA
jgi:hypothetical protein